MRSFIKNPVILIPIIIFLLFNKTIIKGLVAAPLDIIVGIYYPFRDYIWNNLIAGVPFKNSMLTDVVAIIIPWRELAVSQFQHFEIPLFNPFSGSSMPLAANFQSAVFYPLNLLIIIFTGLFKSEGFLTAWNIYIILAPLLSSIFFYIFLRNKKIGNYASILGSITFSLSAFMINWLEYGVVVHSALYLPLMLLSVDKIIHKINKKYFLLLSISICLSILAGYPQITVYSLFLTFIYTVFHAINNHSAKVLFPISFAIILGIGLSGIQLLPSMELLQQSIRGVDEGLGTKNFGYLPITNLITAFFPDVYGNPSTGNFTGPMSYTDTAFYLGIFPLVLAFFALFQKKQRDTSLLIGVSLLSIIFSTANPLSKWIHSSVPGLSGGVPSRALILLDFSIALLCAYGFDEIIKREKKSLRNLFITISIFVVLITTIALIIYGKINPVNLMINDFQVAKRNMIFPLVVFSISSSLSVVYLMKKVPKKLLSMIPVIIILIISAELVRQGIKINSFSAKEYFYPATGVTNYLKNNSGLYRVSATIPTNMTIPYRLYSPEAYDALISRRYSEFLGILNNKKPLPGSRYANIYNYNSNLIDLLGVKYVINYKQIINSDFDPEYYKFPEKKFSLVYQDKHTQIYENKKVFPRAFLAFNYQKETDNNQIAELLSDDNFDLRNKIILEQEINYQSLNDFNKSEEVNIEEYLPSKIKISVKAPTDAILFLSDNYYPGWRAFVDGKETKIYRADYSFRAILVPNGNHTVNFQYSPNSFKLGFFLSFISLIFLMAFSKIFVKNEKV